MSRESEFRSDLGAAHALFAALEARSVNVGEAETLPYLGMARAELVGRGQTAPTEFDQPDVESFTDGLMELEELLTRLISNSLELGETLRLMRARDVLREGILRR
jgi:hypothetical protein